MPYSKAMPWHDWNIVYREINNILFFLKQYVVNVKLSRYTITLFYLLKPNRVIVPDEIHQSYHSKNIERKDPKFSDRSAGQTVQTQNSLLLRNRCDKGIHSCHSVCTLLWNRNKRPIIIGQRPTVVAAGTELKLFDFFLGGGAYFI